jgi:hypothetical protein
LAADVDLSPSYFKLNITRRTGSSLDKHVLHFHSILLKSKQKKSLRIARSLPFLILRPISLFRADHNIFCSLHSDLRHGVLLCLCLSLLHTTHRKIYRRSTGRTGESKGKDTAYIPGAFCIVASFKVARNKTHSHACTHTYMLYFLVSEVMHNKVTWEIQNQKRMAT